MSATILAVMVLFAGVDMTEHYLYNTTEATAVIFDINTFGGRQELATLPH